MAEQSSRKVKMSDSLEMRAMFDMETDESIDLMDLVYRLIGKWKQIICMALAFGLAAGVYTSFFVTPMYQASSTIYVLNRRDSAINISDLQIGSALTSDYIKVFDMWEIHEAVISNLDLPYSYSQIAGMLSVVNESNTRMLDITITSPDPQEAAAIAGEYATVTSQYIADTMAMDKPSIMSTPLVPTNPVSPNKTMNIMTGLVLGAFLMVAYITVDMLLDDKYKTAEDIQRYTGLVNLASIPIDESKQNRARAKNSRRPL